MFGPTERARTFGNTGSRDKPGPAATYDRAFAFGNLPSTREHREFTDHEFAKLLILRGRVRNGEYAAGPSPVDPTLTL
jgi:hypothetical protein